MSCNWLKDADKGSSFYQSCKFSLLWYIKIKGDIKLFYICWRNEWAHVQPWPSPCLKYLISVMIKIWTLQYSRPALPHSLHLVTTSQYPHGLKSPELYHTRHSFCALAYAGLLALLSAFWNLLVIFPDPDQEFSTHGRPPWLPQWGWQTLPLLIHQYLPWSCPSEKPVTEAWVCLFTSLSCRLRTRKLLTPACSVLCVGPRTSQDLS